MLDKHENASTWGKQEGSITYFEESITYLYSLLQM